MLEQKTIVDVIEITGGNDVQVRLALLVLNDNKELTRKYHRTIIPAVDNGTALQMAEVNDHLAQLGEQPVGEADIARIAAFAEFTKSQGA